VEPLPLARALAVVNAVLVGAAVGVAQRAYDAPGGSRRLRTWTVLTAGAGAGLVASDAVWEAATRSHAAPPAPDVVLAAPEAGLLVGHLAVVAVAAPVWLAGRGVPDRLRRRGVRRPHHLLAVALGVSWTVAAARVEWTHARERTAALDL